MAKKKTDEKIAIAQVAPSEVVDKGDMPPADREPRNMQEYLGLSAEIAQSTNYVRNSRWDGAREDFPHEPLMRTCEKFFKDASGGPLYIDEPRTRSEKEMCVRKAQVLKKRGLRYCYIFRVNGIEPHIDEVLAQLEGEQRGVA